MSHSNKSRETLLAHHGLIMSSQKYYRSKECLYHLEQWFSSGLIKKKTTPDFVLDGNKICFIEKTSRSWNALFRVVNWNRHLTIGENSLVSSASYCYQNLYTSFGVPTADFSGPFILLRELIDDFLPKFNERQFDENTIIPRFVIENNLIHFFSPSTLDSTQTMSDLLDLYFSNEVYHVGGELNFPMFDQYKNYYKTDLFQLLIKYPECWDHIQSCFTDKPERISLRRPSPEKNREKHLNNLLAAWKKTHPEYSQAIEEYLVKHNLTIERIIQWKTHPFIRLRTIEPAVGSGGQKKPDLKHGDQNKQIALNRLHLSEEGADFSIDLSSLPTPKITEVPETVVEDKSQKLSNISDSLVRYLSKIPVRTVGPPNQPERKDPKMNEPTTAFLSVSSGDSSYSPPPSVTTTEFNNRSDVSSFERRLAKALKPLNAEKEKSKDEVSLEKINVTEKVCDQSQCLDLPSERTEEMDQPEEDVKELDQLSEGESEDLLSETESSKYEYDSVRSNSCSQAEAADDQSDKGSKKMPLEDQIEPANLVPASYTNRLYLTDFDREQLDLGTFEPDEFDFDGIFKPSNPVPLKIYTLEEINLQEDTHLKKIPEGENIDISSDKTYEIESVGGKSSIGTNVSGQSSSNKAVYVPPHRAKVNPISLVDTNKLTGKAAMEFFRRTIRKDLVEPSDLTKMKDWTSPYKSGYSKTSTHKEKINTDSNPGLKMLTDPFPGLKVDKNMITLIRKRKMKLKEYTSFANDCYAESLNNILMPKLGINCIDLFGDGKQHDLTEYWTKLVRHNRMAEFGILEIQIFECVGCKKKSSAWSYLIMKNTDESIESTAERHCVQCNRSELHKIYVETYYSDYVFCYSGKNLQLMSDGKEAGKKAIRSLGQPIGGINYSGDGLNGHYSEEKKPNLVRISFMGGRLPREFFSCLMDGETPEAIAAMIKHDQTNLKLADKDRKKAVRVKKEDLKIYDVRSSYWDKIQPG